MLGLEPLTHGFGIRVPDQGARAAAMGGAFCAIADDASAIFYNSAGLTQQTQPELALGSYIWIPHYHAALLNGEESMTKATFIPHAYFASDFGLENWRFGIGINNPLGTGVDWGDQGALRTIVTEARLSILNASPTVAYALSDRLSIGVSLNLYYADAHLERQMVLAPPPFPEGKFVFGGDGMALSATAALLWKFADHHRLGLVYRGPFDITATGTAKLDHPTFAVSPDSTSADMSLPQILNLGYSFQCTSRLTLAVEFDWTDWNVTDRLSFSSDISSVDDSEIPLNWKSSIAFKAGASYEFSRAWFMRAGYAFWENSVPNATFSPMVPDADYHSLNFGVEFVRSSWRINGAYQANLSSTRQVAQSVYSPLVDGEWRFVNHGITLTASYRF